MPVKTCKDNKNPQQSKIAGDIDTVSVKISNHLFQEAFPDLWQDVQCASCFWVLSEANANSQRQTTRGVFLIAPDRYSDSKDSPLIRIIERRSHAESPDGF